MQRLISWLDDHAGLIVGAFFALVIVMANYDRSQAQLTTAGMANGQYATPFESPCIPWAIGPATGTAEQIVVGGGGTAPVLSTVPYYLSWLNVSTGPISGTNYITIKDTSALSAGGALVVLAQVAYSSAPLGNTTGGGSWGPAQQMVYFQPPIRFSSGIAVTQGFAGGYVTGCGRSYAPSRQNPQ